MIQFTTPEVPKTPPTDDVQTNWVSQRELRRRAAEQADESPDDSNDAQR